MTLDRATIERLIPHAGAMCLLDSVATATELEVLCHASGHRAADHPLRVDGRLPAVVAIEYAAQAMAAHGALAQATAVAGVDARPGYLVAVREVELHVERLDDLEEDLDVHATRTGGDATSLAYDFAVRAGERILVSGRAIVMLAPN